MRCLLGYVSDAQAERWSVPAAMWRSQLIRGITEVDYARRSAAMRSGSPSCSGPAGSCA